MDDTSMKLGLLMEGAHAQQALTESLTEKLRGHLDGLDAVIREELRRTLVEELGSVVAEADRAAESLRRIGRRGLLRHALWTGAVTVLCAYAPIVTMRWLMPSETEIAALQTRRERLQANIELLKSEGGLVDIRRCGAATHLCVRVDRTLPAFGGNADYYVIAGH
jgi:hypothetical protein